MGFVSRVSILSSINWYYVNQLCGGKPIFLTVSFSVFIQDEHVVDATFAVMDVNCQVKIRTNEGVSVSQLRDYLFGNCTENFIKLFTQTMPCGEANRRNLLKISFTLFACTDRFLYQLAGFYKSDCETL